MLHNRSLKHTAGIIELRLEFGHALVPIDLNRVSQQTLFEDIAPGAVSHCHLSSGYRSFTFSDGIR
jgi:hypothetical protein